MKHREALELFDYATEMDSVNRDEALEDMRFRAGEQWPDEERAARELDKRPCLTINRTGQFIRRVTGAVRQSPPSVQVIALDEDGEAENSASLREGIIRHIEHRSKARHEYVGAMDDSASCGIGHLRIITETDERDPFRQEIRIARVPDPLSVLYDPDAKALTKEDGEFVFVTGVMSPKSFKRKYPKASEVEFPRDDSRNESRYWVTGQTVRVAELFRKVSDTRKMLLMSDGVRLDVTDEDEAFVRELLARAAVNGVFVQDEKPLKSHKVMRAVLSGNEYLEEETEFPSRYLPIVPVVGETINVGEKIIRHGVVRFARDPQRLYNYWRTAAAEMIALAPKAPFMATETQIGPYKALWDNANRSPRPYLPYEPDPMAPGPPLRATAPEPPAAMWQEANIASEDLKGVTGIYDASLGASSNETSGKAILARQREGEIGTFIYLDNLRHAIERIGVILLDMLPRVYDSERIVQLIEEDGRTEAVRINQTMEDGSVSNQIGGGTYDVRVTTGPSYQSKKEETRDQLIELVRAFPQIMQVAPDIVIGAMDIPRADEIAERFEAMMQAQAPKSDPGAEADAQKNAAAARRDMAEAEKTAAETEGVALDNLAKRAELTGR